MKDKTMIITGARGFVGSSLVKALTQAGYKTVDLDFDAFRAKGKEALPKEFKSGVTVIHLACSCIPATSELDPAGDIERDLIGTIRLLEECASAKISRFVYLSTGGAIYGDSKKPCKETDPLVPKNSYGALKASIEHYVGIYSKKSGFESVIVRPGNIYGRSHIKNDVFGAVDVFAHKAAAGEEIAILGDGETVRDYIHIDDAVSFITKAATSEMPSGAYNLGTGTGTSLLDIIKLLEKRVGKKLNVVKKPARATDVNSNILDIKKALSTGWKPKYPNLKDGIEAAYAELFDVLG